MNTFDKDAAVPGFTSLPPAAAEDVASAFVFSTSGGLLTPDTLGAEPTLLLAFFILGRRVVMHLQANLWGDMLYTENKTGRSLFRNLFLNNCTM